MTAGWIIGGLFIAVLCLLAYYAGRRAQAAEDYDAMTLALSTLKIELSAGADAEDEHWGMP